MLLEIALAEPASFGIVVTRSSARVGRLAGRAAMLGQAQALLSAVRSGEDVSGERRRSARWSSATCRNSRRTAG